MKAFVKNIQNIAHQHDLWTADSKIVVGVSGGPDSACLLHVLHTLRKAYNLSLVVAHVNYRLRGKDSDRDEQFVKLLAEKYQLPLYVYKPPKSSYKGNLENSLRNIRYEFFKKLKEELCFDVVAVAHNQDDQAETVLMRIARGTGLAGLSAIKLKNNDIIRPLLNTSKRDILAYLKKEGLEYCIDKTNALDIFTRNKVRTKALPYLEKNLNPQLKKVLAGWSLHVAQDYDFIRKSAERFVKKVCNNRRAVFKASDFLKLHPALQHQSLRSIRENICGDLLEVEDQQIAELIKVIKSAKNKHQKASICGLNIIKKGDIVEILD